MLELEIIALSQKSRSNATVYIILTLLALATCWQQIHQRKQFVKSIAFVYQEHIDDDTVDIS